MTTMESGNVIHPHAWLIALKESNLHWVLPLGAFTTLLYQRRAILSLSLSLASPPLLMTFLLLLPLLLLPLLLLPLLLLHASVLFRQDGIPDSLV